MFFLKCSGIFFCVWSYIKILQWQPWNKSYLVGWRPSFWWFSWRFPIGQLQRAFCLWKRKTPLLLENWEGRCTTQTPCPRGLFSGTVAPLLHLAEPPTDLGKKAKQVTDISETLKKIKHIGTYIFFMKTNIWVIDWGGRFFKISLNLNLKIPWIREEITFLLCVVFLCFQMRWMWNY